MKTNRIFIVSLLTTVLVGGTSYAQGKKPPPEKKRPEPSTTLHNAKDGANRALDSVDHGVHQAGSEVKDGANKALQAVDDTVHGRKN